MFFLIMGYLEAKFSVLFAIHVILSFLQSSESATFNINCDFVGQYSGNLPLGKYFPLDIVLGHPHNASVTTHSPCCRDVIVERASCSGCSEGGNNTCFSDSGYVTLAYNANNASDDCKAKTSISILCIAVKCPGRPGSQQAFVAPGEKTGCQTDGKKYVCSPNGNWASISCDGGGHSAIPYHTPNPMGTTRHSTDSSNTTTGRYDGELSSSTSALNIIGNDTYHNETTTEELDSGKAMLDLRNFLIALGTTLLVVIVIVCGFFIKKKKKTAIETDYPLEYWHDCDYVETVMDRGHYSKNSVNPIYASDQSGNGNSKRYKKKEEYARTDARGGKSSSSVISEVPRKVKHDYADRYVATATGSKFYSYRKSPDVDVTDIDNVLEEFANELGDKSPSIPRGTKIYPESSFKPQRGTKKPKKRGDSVKAFNDERSTEDINMNKSESDDIYAVSYKNRLKSRLKYWSAEESDV